MPYFERNLERGKRIAWGEADFEEERVATEPEEFYTMTSEGFPKYTLGGVGFGGGTKTE